MKTAKKILSNQRGYTLLFAVVVSSVVLSIAAFITSVSRKQFILTSASRNSTVAIYGADSGIQCAVEAYNLGYLTPGFTSSFSCNGDGGTPNMNPDFQNTESPPEGVNYDPNQPIKQTVPMIFSLAGKCVILIVTNGTDLDGGNKMTVIDSKGYNVPCSNGAVPDAGPRVEERAIRLVYKD